MNGKLAKNCGVIPVDVRRHQSANQIKIIIIIIAVVVGSFKGENQGGAARSSPTKVKQYFAKQESIIAVFIFKESGGLQCARQFAKPLKILTTSYPVKNHSSIHSVLNFQQSGDIGWASSFFLGKLH